MATRNVSDKYLDRSNLTVNTSTIIYDYVIKIILPILNKKIFKRNQKLFILFQILFCLVYANGIFNG